MSLYGAPPIPLVHRDAYTLLVAVLLSAQCTDKRVNLVTPALFALASTPEEMARQDVEAVREIVRPCGLSERKASAIVNLSRILVEKARLNEITTELRLCQDVEAPVEEGQKLGEMAVYVGDEVQQTIPIVADRAVARLTLPGIFSRFLKTLFMAG